MTLLYFILRVAVQTDFYDSLVLDACSFDEEGKVVNSRCRNEGFCDNGMNSSSPGNFTCACTRLFTGTYCEQGWWSVSSTYTLEKPIQ